MVTHCERVRWIDLHTKVLTDPCLFLFTVIKDLEGLSGEQIVNTELATGVPIVYILDKEGKVLSKEILTRT